MPSSPVKLTLQRSQASPWGLRLQGGADFERALVISLVTEGTPSHLSGLRSGDVLLEINGKNTSMMTHKEAQEAILSCGHQVPLTVLRQDTVSPGCGPTVELVGPAPVSGGVPGTTYTRTSLAKPQVEEDHWDVRHNITAKGFQGAGGAQPAAAGVGGIQPSTGGAGGFRSVSAPITRPGAENRGPPPLVQGQTAYLLSKSGRQPGAAPPSRGPPPSSDWSQRLNNNTAGMAMNAEDFTKEFMKQLTGGQ